MNSPTAAQALLQVNNLSLYVDDLRLLDDISLSIHPGEIVAIIGPNGAGKSSLLQAICGEYPKGKVSHSGEVLLAGEPLAGLAPIARARQLAVLAQRNPLDFAFTCQEVVALGRTPHATGAAIDSDICQAAMAALDVWHLADRLYPFLSGGEQQRVQLARVLAQIWRAEDAHERLLLLDEPVTSLDIGHQWQCLEAVREFANARVTVLMTLHDMTLAAAFSDRLIALAHGRCYCQGSPSDVLTDAIIGAVFDTRVCVIPHPHTGKPVVINR